MGRMLGLGAARGAVAGLVPGLVFGSGLGVLAAWFAGAALTWLSNLSFTTGIQTALLPFGDRIGMLQSVSDNWYWLGAAGAVAGAFFGALIGAVTGLVLAVAGLWLPSPRFDPEPAGQEVEPEREREPEVANPAARRNPRL